MYPSLSAFDFVNYMAELKGVHDRKAVNKALEQVEMLKFSKRKIGQLSGGMKRRVGIAQALVGDPKVLVVDEPTVGLDPRGTRVRFRGVLSRFAKDGRTVLLSHPYRRGRPSSMRRAGCSAKKADRSMLAGPLRLWNASTER